MRTTTLLALFAAIGFTACQEPPNDPQRAPLQPVGQPDTKQKDQSPKVKDNANQVQTQTGGGTQTQTQTGGETPVQPVTPAQSEPPKDQCTDPGASKVEPTEAERAKCRDFGGGSACATNCWNLDFYNKIHAAVNNPQPQPITITCTVTATELRLRPTPSNPAQLVWMYSGEQCTKLGAEGEWFKVRYKDLTGYALSDYLSCN